MNYEKIIQTFKEHLARKQAPEFEVFLSRDQESEVEVKDQKLHAFNASESIGAALRVIVDKKLGFAFTTDFSPASIEKTVELALQTAEYSNPREFLSLARPDTLSSTIDLKDFDSAFSQISQETRLKLALEMEKVALAYDPRLRRARGTSCSGSLSEIFLENSWGLKKHHQKTMNVLALMAVAEEGEEAEGVFEFDFSPFLSSLDPSKVGLMAAQKALSYLGGKSGPTLKCPVILDPLVAADILEVLAPSFFADNLLKKRSLFEGKEKQRVLSDKVNLIDDGLLVGAYASFPFDGEGVACRRTSIIEKGIFQNCLSDLEYGARLKIGSSGSSERESIKGPPQIGHSNLYLEPGSLSFEGILKQAGRGVYITELIGMHTANPISGDFSVGAQGFWVEGGEVKYPLKQMALSGNLKEMLNRVEALGSDLRYYFKVASPSVLIGEMDVAGA